MAYDCGLLWLICGLLYGIVACYFRLLGVPGRLLSSILLLLVFGLLSYYH